MSKHTPGPWSVGEDGDMIWASDLDHRPVLVANVPFTRDPRVEADARLIAAAPELLDALIEAVECGMVPISSAKEGGASAFSAQVRCADRIRAAIAKATGEA
ncbi:hypothetical protein PQS91_10405 [Stenotrophomonas geniculata]|uniref:hypothetical protein n=1 Tax=Stenotrophomonas geniculata TaxID=86188 RepID=UPI00234F9860|nr:hypothetical protein [Stenotrophomonas geniculata]MDC7800258.1 hypothetical protein [Stenotrophomonas geniculata]